MVKEINKNQIADLSSLANVASLLYNNNNNNNTNHLQQQQQHNQLLLQNNTADMNFQDQQSLLATVLMFPSLFMPQTANNNNSVASNATTSNQLLNNSLNFQLPLNTSINNNNNTNNPSFDQLLQQQLMASNLNNYNNTFLASLAGNLIQPQQQQQQQQQQNQHQNEMTASNNIWSKLLTDMSSSLVDTDINQSNILNQMQQLQHTNTLILANNGEVSLKPPSSSSNKPKSNQDSSHNKQNAQTNQMKKNGDKLNYKPNKLNQNETMIQTNKQLSNGSASYSSASSTSSSTSSNSKSTKPTNSNSSSFSIKDLINNNKNNSDHHVSNQAKKSTSNTTSSQNKKTKPINNNNKPNDDLNEQNQALLMYAALLQNSSNNSQTIPFNMFSNNSAQNYSLDWLFQLTQGQSNETKLNNKNEISSNNQNNNNNNNHAYNNNNNNNNKSNESKIKNSSSNNQALNKAQSNSINNNQNNENNKLTNKSRNNFISNMEDQNNELVEEKIRLPLKFGWRRETIIKEVHKNGIKGDVIYYSPCSKKLRTFQEIERYLSRNSKELESKGIKLTRDNFTFSSKFIIGKYLQLKQMTTAVASGDESASTNDELVSDEKLENELKFNILNEEDVILIISKLNPKFCSTLNQSNQNQTDTSNHDSLNSQDSQQYYQHQNHNHTNGKQQSTNNDPELQFKLDTLKQFKLEQENKHAQMLEMQRLEHEQLEQQKLKLKNQQEQAMIQNRLIQQEKQNRLIEAKNREKFLQRERKTREKWFEHIMSREQQTSRQQPIDIGEEKPAQIIFDSIDDMQEKYLKKMPEFKQLYIDSKETTTKSTVTQSDASVAAAEAAALSSACSVASDSNEEENEEQSPEPLKLNWFGDCLQVIEFVNTFGSKLVESLNKASKSTQSDTQLNENNDFQFSSILSNLELFRSGLENKNDKLKREIVHLLQLLLKCAINTISDRNMNINDSINRNNESKEEDDDDDNNDDSNDSSPKDDDLKLVNEDDFYYVKRIKQLEMNDSTYSELLRLYIKRSLFYLKQRRELTAKKFNIDVTLNLFESLKNYNQSLNEKSFDQLETSIKASIMAWLCDELLTSSSSIAGGAGGESNEMANQDEYRVASCVVSDLDQAIEELTELKHEKWQLESKSRQIKTEKLTATINLNKMLAKKTETITDSSLTETTDTHPTQEQETMNESFNSKEKDKQQKAIQQIEKKLTQNEKKRLQVKQSYDKCLNKLRSGIHLGQDRYLRHYWSLSHVGGILIESASQASIGSIYLSDDSVQLMPDDDVVKKEEEENNQIKTEEDLEEESAIQKYSHLIERFSTDDPFKFTLKFNDEEIANLTYRQIEYLVRNEIQQKKPEKIDPKYLNHQNNLIILKNTSSKWWLCENEIMFKQLIDCLAKRGYREKLLVKCLTKLNEENFTNSNSFAAFTDSNTNNESLTTTTETINPTVFNRITNNLGNIQMFERLNNFFKDFIVNTQQPSSQQAIKKFLNQLKQQEYREKTKVLKQMYALEDRVFKANLQQPTEKGLEQQQQNNLDSQDSESPLEIAKSRLLELEARIERRYLKYPFVARRKLTNIKMTNNETNKEETTNDETTMDMEVKEEEENQELPTLSSLSSGLPPQANSKTNKICTKHVDVPQELERWRRLVKNCNTSSQLAILIIELNKLLEWEKSIMKVICQICNCDDNEDKLLLCDNCDKGNHTYCFKPVLDQIPDGDWYCFVCIGKLNGENICCVCGSNEPTCPYYSGSNSSSNSSSDLNKCDKCSKSFHGHCMPYARYYVTKHKWHCLNCQNIKPPVSIANSVDTLNNKRNLSAIHNINNKVNTNNKKKKSPESALNNETVSNSDDCSSSANNTDDVIVSFRKKNNKKFGFTKGKNITNNNKTDKEVTNNKSEKKSNNNKRKRASSHENSNDEIENNENECNQNDLNNKQVGGEENGDEENETETEPNQTDNSQNNKSGKTKRATKKSQSVANKKSRRSDIDKAKAAARPSNSYLSLSSGPKGNPNRDKDLAMCSNLLESMIKNESSLPFANKVDEKIYPDYYELIKEPMDIQTIKLKIKNKEYENKEQFAYDCRLIFDNCEFFNEDDSAIGKAGHKLRAFFETKWLKLFD